MRRKPRGSSGSAGGNCGSSKATASDLPALDSSSLYTAFIPLCVMQQATFEEWS